MSLAIVVIITVHTSTRYIKECLSLPFTHSLSMAHIHRINNGSQIKTYTHSVAAMEHIKDSRVKLILNRLHFQAYEMCLFYSPLKMMWPLCYGKSSALSVFKQKRHHHIAGIHHQLTQCVLSFIHCCSYSYSNQPMDTPHEPTFKTDFNVGI